MRGRALIKAGLDLNSSYVNQAFRLSARRENHHILGLLIKAGVDVNIRGVVGRTALMYSARSGDRLSVSLLLRAGADINTADLEGVTPLMYAARSGDHLCVTSLLQAGAEIHAADSKGVTVLMHMVKGGLVACVKELIESGADVNKADIKGTTALMIAASKGLTKSNKMREVMYSDVLADDLADDEMIFDTEGDLVESEGHVECMELLIEAGADVNIADMTNETALYLATYHGNAEGLKLLVLAGAEVNHINKDNDTPLLTASKRNRCKCIRILVEAGADVNIKGEYGYSALMSVIKCPVCVEVLLDAGADVNSTNGYDQTPLLVCIKYRDIIDINLLPCVKLLLQYGADVNFVSKHNNTPLTCAMEYCPSSPIDIVAELIHAGADVNLSRHRDGITPLMLAAESWGIGREPYVRLLLRSGAKINMLNKRGRSVLEMFNWKIDGTEKLVTLLFAAGEKIFRRIPSLDNMKWLTQPEVSLKHLCRVTIRKHLLSLDLHRHLFHRVPKLGLPKALSAYVLYNMTLDDDADDDNDDYDSK